MPCRLSHQRSTPPQWAASRQKQGRNRDDQHEKARRRHACEEPFGLIHLGDLPFWETGPRAAALRGHYGPGFSEEERDRMSTVASIGCPRIRLCESTIPIREKKAPGLICQPRPFVLSL